MKRLTGAAALASLERIARRYRPGLSARKLALLAILAGARLRTAGQVRRLHELLLFLSACPDDRRILASVRRILRAFHRRSDLRRHRAALISSGIAGTDIAYRYFWPTARWISGQWPGALMLDRDDPEHNQAIVAALPELIEPAQAELLRRIQRPSIEVIDRLRPHGITDADYFISLVATMPGEDAQREAIFDRVDPPFILRAGRSTPQRSTARFDRLPVHPQRVGLRGPRPDLRMEARRPPHRVDELDRKEADALIQLARISMATRERDLAVFQYPNARDAFMADDGNGLAFAMVGMAPERRLLLPAVYGGLTLRNGVPIGYVQLDLLGRHAELSFNQFETFRDSDSAHVFARLVAMTSHVFDCDRFSIEPYQLGEDNDEGIESGAWWFYYHLGFRPAHAESRRIVARELGRLARRRKYRSSPSVLRMLARHHLFLSLNPASRLQLPRTSKLLESAASELQRFNQAGASDRRAAAMAAARRWLGIRTIRPGAALLLSHWSGVVLALAKQGDWNRHDRRQLANLIESKTKRSERDYLQRVLRHRRFCRALGC